MDIATHMATVTRRGPGQPLTARSAPSSRGRRHGVRSRLRIRNPHAVALGLLLITTLLLRLWGIKQGLPYSYNVDEATHFVPRAVAFFSHDLNPHYFLNPPAYSYLLHIVFELWFGGSDAVTRAYASNPTDVYVVARVVAAVLGTASVWLTYLAGARFFNKNVGLAAAAIFGLAFLPIFYSHLALNDVPTLAPVALSLYGTACVMRRGRLRDYVIAGVGLGLAAATKYTGGIALLCLLAAFVSDGAGGAFWVSARRLAIGLVVALLAFVLANPYSVLDFHSFTSGVSSQASLAAGQDPVKLGTRPGSGIDYYLWTFTWGLGWGPVLAAIGGAVLLLARRRWAMALILIPAPIAFIIFMGNQQRYFGRWLMPVFPIVAILGAYGAVELIGWLIRERRIPAPAAVGAGVGAAARAEPGRGAPRRRRAVTTRHPEPGSRMDGGARPRRLEGRARAGRRRQLGHRRRCVPAVDAERRSLVPLRDLAHRRRRERQPVARRTQRRYVLVDQYERTLRPELLDQYVSSGYCWLMIGSEQAGRAFAQPHLAPSAIAYYAALATPRPARLPHQPVLLRNPAGAVQLRLGQSTITPASTGCQAPS